MAMKSVSSTSRIATAFALICLLLTAPGTRADFVTDWNQQALDAIQAQAVSSPEVARDLAILHLGMYNAIETISPTYQVYSYGTYMAPPKGSAPLGADIHAAATSAAYTIMQNLFPTLAAPGGVLETQYNAHLSTLTAGQARDDGVAWGQSIASGLLTWRGTDGAAGAQTPYTPAYILAHWVSTSSDPGEQQPLLPSWGSVTPFAVSSVAAHSPPGLGGDLLAYLATPGYAQDFNQVKNLGALNGSTRTSEQTEIAHFWNAGAGTVTAPGMWNEIANTIATDAVYGFNYSMEDNARLFAALNVAMADASIVAWSSKYQTDFWRPQTAIAYGGDAFVDSDGNPGTMGSETWEPLIKTPISPEYIAEHSAFSSAAASVLAGFFGDNTEFTHESDIFGDGSVLLGRNFTSLSGAADESGLSRIYAGANFNTSNQDGQNVGESVGAAVMASNFALVPEPGSALLVMTASIACLRRRRQQDTGRCISPEPM